MHAQMGEGCMGLASKADVCGTVDVPKGDESVAVVLTTYNDAAFLREAISSVIGQKHPADEVIVVDDGSDVSPAPVFADFPQVRLLRKSNGGLSSAQRRPSFRQFPIYHLSR